MPLLDGTQLAGPTYQSFLMEFLLDALLLFVILSVSSRIRDPGLTVGAVVVSVIAVVGFRCVRIGPCSDGGVPRDPSTPVPR